MAHTETDTATAPTSAPSHDGAAHVWNNTDACGDHVTTGAKRSETTLHDTVRNGLRKLLRETCLLVELAGSDALVERELPEDVPGLPRRRPCDVSVLFDHM